MWRIWPSGVSVAAILATPPSTAFSPKASCSVVRWDMPFSTGSTAVFGPIAGRIAAMAEARS
jgi:hypothetical protein